MSILFSNVKLKSKYGEKKFLVRGVPTCKDDIIHYTAYHDYLSSVKENTEVDAHADAYLYGSGESVDATIEEVAYMKMRMEKDPEFLSRHCKKVFDSDFSFRTDDDPDETENAGQALLVGRIGFLDSKGNIGETLDFTDEYAFIAKVMEENYYGVPMHLTFFRNNSGTTIDTSFLSELDPPNVTVDYADLPFERLDGFDMKI